ncbi:Gfo/Idh/MocA family protein [Flavisolibacter tropicus]|uniref:Glucose-fructose oxidoreductase n=1 Tax=Flavisolibacter tropicus TaxID=1492898 RepID=A0A172U194_9BACT|nr:Gfo/Idh/MocA family oxidoreductase [Flavisolibacter tropicus]ANE52992.1 glucose-fructose oxidoreductase [Flavisolibacter tropicus]
MKPLKPPYTRRQFLHDASLTLFSMSNLAALGAYADNTNVQREKMLSVHKAKGKLGIALVGLGGYSGGQLAPALQETQYCYLAGIVTGTPSKAVEWKQRYNIPDRNIYNYQTFDKIKDNKDIDIVYVVLPNALHAEYVIKAAKAGKHVICEKPMAITVEDCDRMIAACKEAGKMLSIGYRLHFEPHNMEIMRIGQKKQFGSIKRLIAENGFSGAGGWRLDKQLAGGGPLMDVGIYCVQGCRYTTGIEPVAVWAQEGPKTDPDKFRSVEESLTWQMEFPNGIIAECKTSYAQSMNVLRAEAENGWAELSPAFAYGGINGKTSKGDLNFGQVNQQARQMDDFAQAIVNNRPTPVPGEMGRQDVKILQAIYQAMQSGERTTI